MNARVLLRNMQRHRVGDKQSKVSIVCVVHTCFVESSYRLAQLAYEEQQ